MISEGWSGQKSFQGEEWAAAGFQKNGSNFALDVGSEHYR